eukprot:GHVT01035342.1.p1 GENE.GHVT01035342.1~~GHVT01035342.1.p1  ORF type:complete len:498 (+),score=84.37 GHVT01035342.1:3097-4590(+)
MVKMMKFVAFWLSSGLCLTMHKFFANASVGSWSCDAVPFPSSSFQPSISSSPFRAWMFPCQQPATVVNVPCNCVFDFSVPRPPGASSATSRSVLRSHGSSPGAPPTKASKEMNAVALPPLGISSVATTKADCAKTIVRGRCRAFMSSSVPSIWCRVDASVPAAVAAGALPRPAFSSSFAPRSSRHSRVPHAAFAVPVLPRQAKWNGLGRVLLRKADKAAATANRAAKPLQLGTKLALGHQDRRSESRRDCQSVGGSAVWKKKPKLDEIQSINALARLTPERASLRYFFSHSSRSTTLSASSSSSSTSSKISPSRLFAVKQNADAIWRFPFAFVSAFLDRSPCALSSFSACCPPVLSSLHCFSGDRLPPTWCSEKSLPMASLGMFEGFSSSPLTPLLWPLFLAVAGGLGRLFFTALFPTAVSSSPLSAPTSIWDSIHDRISPAGGVRGGRLHRMLSVAIASGIYALPLFDTCNAFSSPLSVRFPPLRPFLGLVSRHSY